MHVFLRNIPIYTCIFVMCVNVSDINQCMCIQCVCRNISIHVSVWHASISVCKVMTYLNIYQIFGWICNEYVFININVCICFQCMQISNEKKVRWIQWNKNNIMIRIHINESICTCPRQCIHIYIHVHIYIYIYIYTYTYIITFT